MKKGLGIAVAIIIFLVLVTTVFISEEEQDDCVSSPSSASLGVFARPVDPDVPITSGYGPRWGGMHNGIDFGGPLGAPIYSFADGVVAASQDQGVQGFGGWVIIDHNVEGKKISTVYGHQDPGGNLVKVGDRVKVGQQIARIGNSGQSTGPHLHFELHEGGYFDGGHHVDPAPWLEKVGTVTAGDKKDNSSHEVSGEDIRIVRARQIIARGHERDVDEKTILAALAAAIVESDLKMLASQKVPESLQYPYDEVAFGDHDSVGLFQIRVSIHGPRYGGIKGLMDPRTQIDWFYDTAAYTSGATAGELAANVERPAAQYRGRYQQRMAEAQQLYEQLRKDSAGAGSLSGGVHCDFGEGLPAGEVNAAILAAAQKQFGLPYVWGGGNHHGPTGGGFDCSGLTMYAVYQGTKGAVVFDHQTDKQFYHPAMRPIAWEDRRPGDLLFFKGNSAANPWEEYHHVSIYSGEKGGKPMQYEAQTYGVNSGEYPVRFGEPIEVRRISLDADEVSEKDEEKDK